MGNTLVACLLLTEFAVGIARPFTHLPPVFFFHPMIFTTSVILDTVTPLFNTALLMRLLDSCLAFLFLIKPSKMKRNVWRKTNTGLILIRCGRTALVVVVGVTLVSSMPKTKRVPVLLNGWMLRGDGSYSDKIENS